MKLITSLLLSIIFFLNADAQEIYSKTFGNPNHEPILFLHGGPGYNCANFEATTAQKLANNGFFVIVYDRRGEGRSKDTNAQFTFQETYKDINALYQKYGISTAHLIGHSFGGVVSTLYAEKHPEKTKSITLVGAPVSLQETFKTIISTTKDIYASKNDSTNLNYISMIEKMDSSSISYSSFCFMHAMQNGFYKPKNISEEASEIYAQFKTDSLLLQHATQMTYQAPQGFWKNEAYTTIDLTENLKKLKQNGTTIYALYGKDDGLYSENQVMQLQEIIGKENLEYIENCSHSVFIDQQDKFIKYLKKWLL